MKPKNGKPEDEAWRAFTTDSRSGKRASSRTRLHGTGLRELPASPVCGKGLAGLALPEEP